MDSSVTSPTLTSNSLPPQRSMGERPCACAATPSVRTKSATASALPAGTKFKKTFFIRYSLRPSLQPFDHGAPAPAERLSDNNRRAAARPQKGLKTEAL